MITSNVNFGLKFHLAGDKKVNSKTGKKLLWKGKVSYISRDEITLNHDKIFNEDDDSFLISSGYLARDNSRKYHKEKFKNHDEENKILYFSEGKSVRQLDKEIIKANENLLDNLQNDERGCYYESFISFDKKYAQKNLLNKYSEEELYNNLKPYINNFLKTNNFDLHNTKDFVAFHSNTENLHLHFDFVELNPTRIKNQLDKKSFGELRKEIMLGFDEELNSKYQNNNKELMKNKNNLRQEIKNVNTKNINLDTAVKLWQENNVRFYSQIKDENLLEEIDKIKIELLSSDEGFSKSYENFKNNLDKQNKFNQQIYGNSSRDQKENQIEEIEKVIANKILKEIKNKSKEDGDSVSDSTSINEIADTIISTSIDYPNVINNLGVVKEKVIDQIENNGKNNYENNLNKTILKEIKSRVRQQKENLKINNSSNKNNYKTNKFHSYKTKININELKSVIKRQEREQIASANNLFEDELEL